MLLASNSVTYTSINACNLTNNTAGSDGSGLNLTGGATVLTNSTFASNQAGGQGGGLLYTQQGFDAGRISSAQPCHASIY